MSKYRIHIENIGEGADWDGSTIECEGFAIIGDKTEDECNITLHDVSTVKLAAMIAGDEKLRAAARIGLAMYEAKMDEQRSANPLAAIIKAFNEEDD